ncbi:hypothetical protein ESZ28_03180 [Colwellia hornerae]|uniref:Uncharacterized protein n=1 Tax=Colwellia hornerae TaxID=89402 RepID=A0A5C6QSP3_9GAMM|nr:hypothetical protein ESZ28_03180 [Colwellia hornerae]TWX62686.1 hypothetical protein ESZ26_01505 [Colwellia hornerae]TWX71591.1 hypothetical protein ESZ27_01115 [Colwellia hornerae]
MGMSDLFFGYSQQMQESRSAQLRGDFVLAAASVISVNSHHNNYGLSQLEKARLQFLAHDGLASQKSFELAYQQVQAQEQAAKIQISSSLKKVSAVVTNDNAIGYEIPSYEQGMLHSYQALNYLYQGNLEGALVEVRRANLVQERALKTNQAELYSAEEAMADKGINSNNLYENLPAMDNLIGNIKNSFQNAYTFYLSALLYETGKQYNDAYIDYKRALEIYPNNTFLQQDVLRLANKLDMNEDYTRFEQRFGRYQTKDQKNSGQIVVIFEQGIVSAKEEASVNLPIFNTRADFKFFTFALPVYRGRLSTLMPLSISLDEKSYLSQEIVRLQSLATKDLQEKLPGLVTRQAIRLVAKEQIRQNLSKSAGDVGNILASLYNIASEKADTRSWSSLPNNVQIMRLNNVAVGHKKLTVSYSGVKQVIDIEVVDSKITLINFTAIGNYTGYQTINF